MAHDGQYVQHHIYRQCSDQRDKALQELADAKVKSRSWENEAISLRRELADVKALLNTTNGNLKLAEGRSNVLELKYNHLKQLVESLVNARQRGVNDLDVYIYLGELEACINKAKGE